MSAPLEIRLDRETFAGVAAKTSERARVIRTGEREPINQMLRQLVYRRDRWQCQHCGAFPYAADPHRQSGALHIDHIVPWSAGGPDRSDNLRTLCGPCNMERSNYVSDEDRSSIPIVGVCSPCLASSNATVAAWCTQPLEHFAVYCGSRSHHSWAIKGWRIL